MKYVLLSPPFLQDYMRNARCDFVSLSKSNWYPIFLGQAGAWLEKEGHEVKLVDAPAHDLSHQATLDLIADYKPDFIAVYTGRLSEENDVAFADQLQERTGSTIVFVGPYCSIDPAGVLRQSKRVNLAVKGEFELPLAELGAGVSLAEIKNLHYRADADSEIAANPERPLLKQDVLDQFPYVSEFFSRQINMRNYRTPSEPYPFVDMMTGRGCAWGKCNFCLWVHTFIPGSVYNYRSIEHLMGEFEFINKQLPFVKGIMLQDDMLTKPRAVAISEGLMSRGLKMTWSCYVKPNSNFDVKTFQMMKQSGCLNLHVGFESGNEEVLRHIKKGSTVEQAELLGRYAHEAGLRIHADFAIGHLGETKESIRDTVRLAKKINPHTAQFQLMIPFKGTPFYDDLAKAGNLNAKGEPNYEGRLTAEEMRREVKKAYRSFYISTNHAKTILKNPHEVFLSRLDQYGKALASVVWGTYIK